MALNKEQAAQLAELEKLRDAADDEEVEVYVRDERNRETRLTGAQAQRWLTQLFGEDPAPPAKSTPPAKKAGKAPAAPPAEESEGEEGEEGEEGDPPPARKHWLFGTAPAAAKSGV